MARAYAALLLGSASVGAAAFVAMARTSLGNVFIELFAGLSATVFSLAALRALVVRPSVRRNADEVTRRGLAAADLVALAAEHVLYFVADLVTRHGAGVEARALAASSLTE